MWTEADQCHSEGFVDPCAVVIIGASGDLTGRKIIPALYHLYQNKRLPDNFFIVGCARSELGNEGFRKKMEEVALERSGDEGAEWQNFASLLHYVSIEYEGPESFKTLRQYLSGLEEIYHTHGNKIFYLAIPPSLYKPVATNLGESGLAVEKAGENWCRIIVEKPFGRDIDSARDLDRAIHIHFKEHQVFRIDHYLAKETVQNILIFRFANSIFEPVWNRNFIDHINIIAAESLGVEHRAGYYEQAGVLRDMFQNHMMQLLAMTAMEPPSLFEADRVRDEKAKVYRSLRPFPVEKLEDYLLLGQYQEGIIKGHRARAYRDEPGINPDSVVPTFAMMKVFLDNWRWQGVPFYLTSGKRLLEKKTEISIQFKGIPHSMFRQSLGEHISANRLILGIYPDEKITLTFQTKNPGTRVCLRSVTMDFHYAMNYGGRQFDAYEKVLLDCMLGDQMLFWRQDGVELCWSFLTPIIRECESCIERKQILRPYKAGSWGPMEVNRILQQNNDLVS
ncbi:MAG: glucose-6-phosphate dehydrogenase [Deltaproteobacteria bacterium]|nr:glucose-6-phosphate dehydrogenase [Deltaproteobacteria bacterium]